MVDERWAEPESALATVGLHLASVDHDGGAVGFTGIDVGGNLVAVGLGDQRPHVGAACAVADLQAHGAVGDLRHEFIGDTADGNERGDGHAPLARRAEAGVHHGVGCQIEICIGKNDGVVLGAAERLHSLAVRCCR